MASLLGQVGVIAVTDLRLRLRRPGTLWLVLVLCGLAYLIIPDPAGGHALMVMDGARARYTSQVVALATAVLASFLLTFGGFYLTSNALRRELLSRTGGIIAATPVDSGTYLVGKFLGGAGYLGVVTGIYLLNIIAMHLLRGEGPLEPLTYLLTYLLTLAPGILVVAALALCFECLPILSGRLGDVAYFFLWTLLVAVGAIGEGHGAGRFLDIMGLGFTLGQVNAAVHSTNMAIGMTPFDPTIAPWVLPPLALTRDLVLPRLTTALFCLPILLLARLGFHRFDPARTRGGSQSSGGHLVRRISTTLKPLTRWVGLVGTRLVPVAPGALRPVLAETVMSLCQAPLVPVAWLGVVLASVVAPTNGATRMLPLVVCAILTVALADLSTRDRAAGVQAMLFSLPRLKPDYARIKLAAGTLLGLGFVLPVALRIALVHPASALSLVLAAGFMAALSTSLGLLTRTPKTFMGIFLLFLYLVLNGAQLPALDFAGWNGVATASTRVGYLLATLVLAALAEGKHRWDIQREG